MIDLEALGNFGDFVGGLAVIASLLYLARQIRQNTDSVRQSVSTAYLQANIEHNRLMIQDAEVANAYWSGVRSREALSVEDRRRFDGLINIVFRTYQHAFGLGPEVFGEDELNISGGIKYLLAQPGVLSWWKEYSQTCSPGFCRFVESLIEESTWVAEAEDAGGSEEPAVSRSK